MIRMMTMVMKDDNGDDDGAWLNCDTTIARLHCEQPCFASYAFRNTPSLWDRHGACNWYELHCLQESNQTQSKEIKSNQKAIGQQSNAINMQSQNNQTQSKSNQAQLKSSKRNQKAINKQPNEVNRNRGYSKRNQKK